MPSITQIIQILMDAEQRTLTSEEVKSVLITMFTSYEQIEILKEQNIALSALVVSLASENAQLRDVVVYYQDLAVRINKRLEAALLIVPLHTNSGALIEEDVEWIKSIKTDKELS